MGAPSKTLRWIGIGVGWLLIGTHGAAAQKNGCQPTTLRIPQGVPQVTSAKLARLVPAAVDIHADRIELQNNHEFVLHGTPQLRRPGQLVRADELVFNKSLGLAEARGRVVLYTERGDRLETSYIRLELESDTGSMGTARFRIADREQIPDQAGRVFVRGHGIAQSATLEAKNRIRFHQIRFTTCDGGKEDTTFTADEAVFDESTGVLTSLGAKLIVRNPGEHRWVSNRLQ